MLEQIFQINYDFEPWSHQHIIPLALFIILGIGLIRYGITASDTAKWKTPYHLSLLLPASIVLWMILRLWRNEFDPKEDLPLHMCNLVTFFIPFVFHPRIRQRRIFGVIYFWVLAGTLQAVLTPGLEQAYPHYWYFRYWLVHCGLVILILYAVMVLKFRPSWRDLWTAMITMNILFVIAYAFNLWLGSNYLYTMHKPLQPSLLDFFGPWPIYILVSEVVALLFFLIYFFPFIGLKKSRRKED